MISIRILSPSHMINCCTITDYHTPVETRYSPVEGHDKCEQASSFPSKDRATSVDSQKSSYMPLYLYLQVPSSTSQQSLFYESPIILPGRWQL